MRRTATMIVLAAVAAVTIAAPAAAKWVIVLDSSPGGLAPGEPWQPVIRVVGSHFQAGNGPPVVRIWNPRTDLSRTYRAQRVTGRPRTFEATIRFPAKGLWRYVVRYRGARFSFDPVVIESASPPAAAPSDNGESGAAAGSDGGGFPFWPILGGSLALALLAGAGLAARRGRTLRPWPAAPSSARTASRGR